MNDDGLVEIWIDGRFWGKVDRAKFERDWADAAPLREALHAEAEEYVTAMRAKGAKG